MNHAIIPSHILIKSIFFDFEHELFPGLSHKKSSDFGGDRGVCIHAVCKSMFFNSLQTEFLFVVDTIRTIKKHKLLNFVNNIRSE